MGQSTVFPPDFIVTLRGLIGIHHSIYARVPPQGIYFEALVEEAFKRIKKPFTIIEPTGRNQPRHDLLVENTRVSLKTETGEGTDPERISITKLCTTEREPWTPDVLVERAMEHLRRHDVILMLRAVWELPVVIHYQLLEIPVDILRLIRAAKLQPVGKRKGRQSLGADMYRGDEKLYHVHFDGSDGKCQIRDLNVQHCSMLEQWDTQIRD
ncbi:MAG: hypothetical protein ACRD35_01375 [Candidatus Acidiferrales bacterium]